MSILLAQTQRSSIRTRFLNYTHDLPEYPQTHPDGYTYVIYAPDKSKLTIDRTIESEYL